MTYTPDIVIYHDNCMDGFAAYMACLETWGNSSTIYIPMNYGQKFPDHLDFTDKDILVVDFSWPLDPNDFTERRWRNSRSLTFIDHHKSAQNHMSSGLFNILPPLAGMEASIAINQRPTSKSMNVFTWFDMNQSGATMAYQWTHGVGRDVLPQLYLYIEDRDLWRFERLHTKHVHLYLKSNDPLGPATFQRIKAQLDSAHPDAIYEAGRNILRYQTSLINNIVRTASKVKIGAHEIPYVDCPYDLASDVANTLLKNNPTSPFAAAIVHAYGGTTFSLRSADDRLDVSVIAERYGGGGHRNAAGFRYDPADIVQASEITFGRP